ncbi:hypothetical protein GCM10027343_34020 [Noviherbaspirillum agri]
MTVPLHNLSQTFFSHSDARMRRQIRPDIRLRVLYYYLMVTTAAVNPAASAVRGPPAPAHVVF